MAQHEAVSVKCPNAEYPEAGGVAQAHWVEPPFMAEEEMRSNPRFADVHSPTA